MSFLTPENIEYNEANIRSTADGLYKKLWGGNYAFNCRTQILNVGADDIVTGMLNKSWTFVDELNYTEVNNNATSTEIWKNMYGVVRASNEVITSITPTTLVNEEIKNRYIAEAYFMRAYAYFHLVRTFGDVPLFEDMTCVTDIYGRTGNSIQRAPVKDAYDQIIVPDLLHAIELLPNRGRRNDNSTVSKWAAKALLADVYLTMAGWPLKRGQEYYGKAKVVAEDIIDNGGYSLLPSYKDLWMEATKSDHTEHIFALNHSTIQGTASNYGRSYYAREESAAAWSDYLADSSFYVRFPADKRKEFNFITTVRINNRPTSFERWEMRSPAIAKYRDFGTELSAQSDGITPIYRYADVLFMFAEAQNMADGSPNAKAIKAINDIRNRAKEVTSGNELPIGLSFEEFNQAVFDERGWELFAEFKRWFQLVRQEKVWEANQFNPRVKKAIDDQVISKDNRIVYIFPLPTRDLQLTGWPQNPR